MTRVTKNNMENVLTKEPYSLYNIVTYITYMN